MEGKKVIFIIVEGPTDNTALGYFFNKIFENDSVHVEVMHCDITTEKKTNRSNVVNKCTQILRSFAINNHYTRKDFKGVIHIVDTDGAFVDESSVEEDVSRKRVFYTTEKIISKNKENILARNASKAYNLQVLVEAKYLWSTVPYQVYYMSSNLDHVLYNRLNSSNDEKGDNSYLFYMKYKNDLKGFIKYISDSDFSVKGSYMYTWDFIAQGSNSLKRYTNIGLSFNDQAFSE